MGKLSRVFEKWTLRDDYLNYFSFYVRYKLLATPRAMSLIMGLYVGEIQYGIEIYDIGKRMDVI